MDMTDMRTPSQPPDKQARQMDTIQNVQGSLADDSPSAVHRYGVAALCVVGATLLRWLLDPVLGPSFPLATIFGFVGIAVWYGGGGPALFTVVTSYLIIHWLIIEPRHAFNFSARELGGLSLYLFSTLVLIGVGQAMRRAQQRARLNAAAVIERQRQLEAEVLERQSIEQALHRTLNFDEAVMLNMGEGLYTVDVQGLVISMNPAAERLFGWTLDEVRGRKMHDVVHYKHRDGTPFKGEDCAGLKVLREATVLTDYEDVFIRKDGTCFDVSYSARTLREHDETIGLVIVFRDITDRKQAEAALRESEVRYRATFSNAAVGIAHVALDGRWLGVNDAVCRITGYGREELLMKPFADITHPDDLDLECANAQRLVAGEITTYSMEKRYLQKEGGITWIHLTVSVQRDEFGLPTNFICIIEDITERKHVEEDLRNSEERLRSFSGQLEHMVEKRTQELVSSQDRLRMMATELNLAEQRERKRLAGELHDYLAQLLVLCRLNLGQVRRTSLPEKADGMIKETEDVLNKALDFCRTLMAELSPPVLQEHGLPAGLKWLGQQMQSRGLNVMVDVAKAGEFYLSENCAVLLYQSVRELLINVLKHANCQEATVHLQQEDGKLRIEIYDDGSGFDLVVAPADYIITAMSSKFGLYSIRERMKALGGRFELTSGPGKGTRATLLLPIDVPSIGDGQRWRMGEVAPGNHQPYPTENGEIVPIPEEPLQQRIRVLLVDDHAMVRQGLRSVLDQYDTIEVVGEAWNGEEAVAAAAALSPTIVLMDINMPKMNGIDATAAIKARFHDMIVIGLSVQAGGANEEAMIQAGASMLLTKEAAVDELHQAIERVLRKVQQHAVETS
jgi:PAS domain S-box-containing protein